MGKDDGAQTFSSARVCSTLTIWPREMIPALLCFLFRKVLPFCARHLFQFLFAHRFIHLLRGAFERRFLTFSFPLRTVQHQRPSAASSTLLLACDYLLDFF